VTTHELARKLAALPDIPVVLAPLAVICMKTAAGRPDWTPEAPMGWLVETQAGTILHLVEKGGDADRAHKTTARGRS
jgi:hypothetical protein